jgi:TusE/DsrC/DsvC family sulfur relay protein
LIRRRSRRNFPGLFTPSGIIIKKEENAIMPTIELGGKSYEVDEEGFLQELDRWNENFAQAYAGEVGIEGSLTEEHWKVIHYLRNYYQQYGIAPMIRKLCKDTGFDLKKIYQLFPAGPAKGACKLAGFPKPTGCV